MFFQVGELRPVERQRLSRGWPESFTFGTPADDMIRARFASFFQA